MAVKRKKLWIILAVVCGVIFTLGLVFGLAFRLKKVDIEFVRRETPSNLEYNIAEKIKDDGEFEFGKNILFMNFDESISKIEKKNPYVKVNQVIKAFPNIVRVYIIERIPQYRVQDKDNKNKWYILDEEFKVLEVFESEDIRSNKFFELTLEINPSTLTLGGSDSSLGVGDFIKFTNDYGKYLDEISDGIYAKNKSSVSAFGVEIEKSGDDFIFTVTMRSEVAEDGKGCKIQIIGKEELYNKVLKGVTAFEEQVKDEPELNDNSNTIVVEKRPTGEIVGILKKDSELNA